MSTIRDYTSMNGYSGTYPDRDWQSSAKSNAASFLSGLNIGGGSDSGDCDGINLSDYHMIKSGTYKKLLNAYYSEREAERKSGSGDSGKSLTLMQSSANATAKSLQNLMKESVLTGDREKLTKAVKSFLESYNSTVEKAGDLNTKGVLRNAAWMTKTTALSEKLLAKVGISIDAENKLTLDEEELKAAKLSDLKSVFSGQGSYASKIMQKAGAIESAAAGGSTYTNSGGYASAFSELFSARFDEEK